MTANRCIQSTAVAREPRRRGEGASPADLPRLPYRDLSLNGVRLSSDRVELDLEYRPFQGGADNDEVYAFTFVPCAVAGMQVRF